MPDWSVQRRFPRYMLHLPLLYTASAAGSTKAEIGWTFELSEGGACVELSQRLPPKTLLHLSFHKEDGSIEVEAEVVWAGEPTVPSGILHGVAFTQIAPDQLQALRDLLQSAGPVRDAGVRLRLDLAVTCHREGQGGPPLQGRTGDISREGLLLLLPEVLPLETVLEVTLHTPTEPLTMQGKIVWVDPPEIWIPGEPVAHGLRFMSLRWFSPLVLALLLGGPGEGPHGSSPASGDTRPR